MPFVLVVLVSYLIGSIPCGYVAGRLVAGIDIRTVGSGNIGATNVGRTLGWHWFGVVLALDFLKGFGPASLAPAALVWLGDTTTSGETALVLCGLAAILGHLWPLWLRFQGGKGVATALGVVTAVAPLASWIPPSAALATFLVALALTRYVSLGSILAAVVYGALSVALLGDPVQRPALFGFSVLAPILVIWRHRANIGRLWRGEENKVGRKAKPAEPSRAEAKP
jgi:glycerol-3-phosphate acyltransferase PlsY